MIFRHSAGESVRENGGKKQGGSERKYSRFFEGFDEVAVPKEGGKGFKLKRIYTADYYKQELTDRNRIILRIFYILCFIVLCVLFGSAAVSRVISNSTWYVGVFQAACLALLLWLLIALVYYVPSEKLMTVHIYRSMTQHFRRSTAGLSCGFAALAIADLVCVAVNAGTAGWGAVSCSLRYAVCAVISAVLYITERKVVYSTAANPKAPKKKL
ncbi:MAG: hypothetical protein ACI3VB_04330 [Oscillospiraceae bacterium]